MSCSTILVWVACLPLVSSQKYREGWGAARFELWQDLALGSIESSEEGYFDPFKARLFLGGGVALDAGAAEWSRVREAGCRAMRSARSGSKPARLRLSGGRGVRTFERKSKKNEEIQ